jgi:hypothetical protein
MSQRPVLARFLFDATSFSSQATQRTWRTIVCAGAMIGASYVATPSDARADQIRVAQADQGVKKQPAPPAPPPADTEPAPPAGAEMTLDKASIDFGTIEAGKKKTVTFGFMNSGTKPLKLEKKRLKSSCKCLVAVLPREPIAPGARGVIKATFTAPRTAGDASHSLIVKYLVDPATKNEASAVMSLAGTVEKKRPRTPPQPRIEGRGFILS